MARTITVLPGDGIGPEVMAATIRLLDSMHSGLEWDYQKLGLDAGPGVIPEKTIDSVRRNGVALKGPTETPPDGHRSVNVGLREKFELFANIRPVHMHKNVRTPYEGRSIDIVVVRENLEDLYIGEERLIFRGAEAVSRITVEGTRRVARAAFEYARKYNRKKVTVVAKNNILKRTHGLFLAEARAVAAEYPKIECDDLIADNAFQQLILRPERFDVVLLPNFLGDLFSDACAAVVGGLGFAPGANIGKSHAVFEAVHGTAPDIVGKGIANPAAMMLSAAMMLEHIGMGAGALCIQHAIRDVMRAGEYLTGDVRREGSVSTEVFTDAVIRCL